MGVTIGSLSQALERFEPVIGLEVHAQLMTSSKLFSSAPNRYDPDKPNHFVTEYCLGLPGVLPVLNERAVELAVRCGAALGCDIHATSTFSRKQYFYPDLPKGYQISQFDEPLCTNGRLEIDVEGLEPRTIRIARIHMEEDAGKSVHQEGAAYSLVDFNRAGVPLVEIVSEPDIESATEAVAYLKALRSILMAIEACDGNMEEGSFRCDANVSVRPRGSRTLGTRTEIKNVNSFKFVQQAIEFEIVRQARLLDAGSAVVQETRLFDSAKKETRSMRGKEEAHDYRYFPDPDLPPLRIDTARIEAARRSLPELPRARRRRWTKELGLPEEHARTLSEEPDVAAYFDAAASIYPEGRLAIANLIKGEILRELKDDPGAIRHAKLQPVALAELARLKDQDRISSSQQKKLLLEIWRSGADLSHLLAEAGGQIDDRSSLEPIVARIVAAQPGEAAKFKAGHANVLGFFMGLVMKETGGKAKPQAIRDLLLKKLNEE